MSPDSRFIARKMFQLFVLILSLVVAGCGGGSNPINVAVTPGSAQALDFAQSVNLSATVSNDSLNKGVSWSMSGPGTLSATTTSSATYTAPASGSTGTAVVTATSVADSTKTAVMNIKVSAAPAITTTSLSAGVEGTAYNQSIAATGGAGSLTYSLGTGTLPTGLSLSSSTGAITGKPTGPSGTANFTVKVTDASTASPQSATQALSIAINLPPAPTITSTSLQAGVEFTAYSQTIGASSGLAPYAFSISAGALPAGLALNATTGAITGTPSGPNGTANFTVQVADSSNPAQTVSKALTLAINLPTAPAVTTTTLPNGTIGSAYNQALGVSGGHGSFTWSITSGTLPAGLTLNAGTGVISGMAAGPNQVSNFTVKVTDSSNPAQSATRNLSITVAAAPLTVTTTGLPNGAVGDTYANAMLQTNGGTSPVTWSLSQGTLPAGLSLNASTGAITGTPTTTGTSTFTVQASDSSVPTAQTATKQLSIQIGAGVSITTTSLPNGTVGTSYTATNLSATGGVSPYTWSVTAGALPGGLTLSSTGQITGQPTVSGTFNFTAKVTDADGGTSTANLSIVVNPAAPLTVATTSGSLPQGTLNTAYPSTNLSATGGVQPYTWSITSGALPGGLTLSNNGQITGTPTASGTFNFTTKVTDSATPAAGTATASLSITVSANSCAGYGSGNESVLHGQYAFLAQGFEGLGSLSGFAAAGSFAADGTGKITAGEVDINLASGPQHLTVSATGSSYSLGSDNRGCAVMSFGGSNSVVLHFAVGGISSGVAARGRVIEFDDADGTGTRIAGILRLQTKTDFVLSSLNARYAFGLDGTDSTGGHVAIGGAVNVNTSTGALSSGYADVDDSGTLISSITGATGSIGTISTTTGRATGSFSGGVGAMFNWAYYVVNKNELFIVSTDTQAVGTPVASGRAFVTGSSFSNASLNGNYIIHVSGSSGGLADSTLGLLTASSGTLNGTLYQYGLGNSPNASTNTITGGTYTVNASSGRAALTGTGNHAPVLYLTTATDGISAIVVGTDNSAIFGFVELQPSANYTNTVSGNYFLGTEDPSDNTITNDVGAVSIVGSTGTVSGTEDRSAAGSPYLVTGSTISGTVSMGANGTGNVGSGTVAVTNGTRLFFIDEGGGPARITVVEQ